MDIDLDQQRSILELTQTKKYQSACEAYFKGRLEPKLEAIMKRNGTSDGHSETILLRQDGVRTSSTEDVADQSIRAGDSAACYRSTDLVSVLKADEMIAEKMDGFTSSGKDKGSDKGSLSVDERADIADIRQSSLTDDNVWKGNYDCNVDIEKPSDYYFSYVQLLRSLHSMDK